jgi:hypothetical protein
MNLERRRGRALTPADLAAAPRWTVIRALRWIAPPTADYRLVIAL